MKQVNHYTANFECGTTRYQGVAESLEEFITMCEEAGYDIHAEDLEIEVCRYNVKDEIGRPCKKYVCKW